MNQMGKFEWATVLMIFGTIALVLILLVAKGGF